MENNITTEDGTWILHEMKFLCKSLYKCNNFQNADVYLNNLKTNKVSQKHHYEIDENITESELLQMAKSLQNNKSTGAETLPTNFYQNLLAWH